MNKANFLKSAVNPEDFPDTKRPEVALVGRSNAGKSTLLNAMCGGSKVAKVSNTPGKTRLINFFDVGQHYRVVDLPGYGYAARERQERRMWAEMIERFLVNRENLVGFMLICDVRREWSEDEQMMYDFAKQRGLEFLCVLTKLDKLGRADGERQVQNWLKTSKLPKENFSRVSALKNDGVRDLEDYIFKSWIKPRLANTPSKSPAKSSESFRRDTDQPDSKANPSKKS
jgi:GTP-binding protein